MELRITTQATVDTVLAMIRQQTDRLGRLQQQAATGKKLNSPSDDPVHVGLLLAAKSQDRQLDGYLTTIQDSQATLNGSVSALREASDILGQVRSLAIEGAQSHQSVQAREAMAQEVDQLLGRLFEVTNRQQTGRYLFAGADSHTQPFVVQAADGQGRPLAVNYHGADVRDAMTVSPRHVVATLYSGAEVFQARQRGPTSLTGATGAAPGGGTDSATGQGTLLVRHASTAYAGGSGVQPGSSSASLDTILGPAGAHQLTIVDTSGTGAYGTIALGGGPAVSFTNADANLQVTGPDGATVFVDASAITPGFLGTIDITAAGTLSVDNGASSVPIDFSANQVVTDGTTGAVTNINSSSIRTTGTDHLDYQGAYDVFQAVMAVRDDLRNLRGLSESNQIQSLSQRLAELDRVKDGVLRVVGEQSATLQHLESLDSSVRDAQLSSRKLIGDLEDADLTEVVVQLQNNQNLLNLTLAAAARLQDPTLLDFLR